MVNVPNSAHIDMGLLPHKGLAGVPVMRDGHHSEVMGGNGCLLQLGGEMKSGIKFLPLHPPNNIPLISTLMFFVSKTSCVKCLAKSHSQAPV